MTGKDFEARVKAIVRERSGEVCEGCGAAPATEFHHRKYKSRGGLGTVQNCLHLCGWGNHTGCHGLAHGADAPEGWSLHSWEDPTISPAALAVGLSYLSPDGAYVPVDETPPF